MNLLLIEKRDDSEGVVIQLILTNIPYTYNFLVMMRTLLNFKINMDIFPT